MPSHHHPSARFNADLIICEDLAKPSGPIQTGVGFLDHMIDQLNSHAQIGVSLVIGNFAAATDQPAEGLDDHNRHKNDQAKLMRLVGGKLGSEIRQLVATSVTSTPSASTISNFSCPLDEALVECCLEIADPGLSSQSVGELRRYDLPPYGKYRRTHIGSLETEHLALFWSSLAEASGLHISLTKVRGNNAHHIVESSFKAFSRALRNLLDGVDTTATPASATSGEELKGLYGPGSDNWKASIDLKRQGKVHRQTKETSISVSLALDGGEAGVEVSTGVKTLDSFLREFAEAANVSLRVDCTGDVWIDEHHTAEDVSIALGQVVNDALGTKAGLNRMWSCTASSGTAVVQVVMDLSNRPDLVHNLFEHTTVEMVGDLSLEMMEHVLESFAVNARMTVHVVERESGDDPTQTVLAVARALGAAFFYCVSVDLRRAGSTASSKGTLSV